MRLRKKRYICFSLANLIGPAPGFCGCYFTTWVKIQERKKYVLVKYKNKHRNCEIKYKNNFTNISKKLQAIPSFQKIENIQNQIKDFFHFSGLVSVTSRAFFQKNFS